MNRICVIGAGYVGLTTAACFAHLGNSVIGSDVDENRVRSINSGELPIVEEGLAELVTRYLASGDLLFTTDNDVAVAEADFVFLCLPTPEGPNGRADMSRVIEVASSIGPHLKVGAVVVNKSTVPIGSANVVRQALQRQDVQVVSNPEFLREGTAIHDFLNPDRVVIGADDDEAAIRLSNLYVKLGAPIVVTDAATAETIKYASNAFLATKLSFVNALAALLADLEANVVGFDLTTGIEGMTVAHDPLQHLSRRRRGGADDDQMGRVPLDRLRHGRQCQRTVCGGRRTQLPRCRIGAQERIRLHVDRHLLSGRSR